LLSVSGGCNDNDGELRNQGGKTARERRKAKPAAKASPLPICTCQGNADDAPNSLCMLF
jgi:hypothetical protein